MSSPKKFQKIFEFALMEGCLPKDSPLSTFLAVKVCEGADVASVNCAGPVDVYSSQL